MKKLDKKTRLLSRGFTSFVAALFFSQLILVGSSQDSQKDADALDTLKAASKTTLNQEIARDTLQSEAALSQGAADPISLQVEKTPSDGPVYLVHVEGMIDNGLAHYIDRAIATAEESGARAILFELDTFGGLVDAADKIRQSILDTELLTVAYINKNAASAGALISLACDSIYMAPGSSIGAATVVEGTGEKASEKMQSYMRGLMRATAEANGRNPEIAEAMVDESIEIEGVSEAGKLLTLSYDEALELGISDATHATVKDLYAQLGWQTAETVDFQEKWEESFLRFLANPVVSGILMLMMMSGLYFEFQTPGFGFGGMAAITGAALFFAPLYIMGLAESWEIILFVVGVLLLFVEIFVIPGFGVAGILGLLLMVFSLGASLIGNVGFDFPGTDEIGQAMWVITLTMAAAIALIFAMGKRLPENRRLNFLVLSDKIDGRSDPAKDATDRDLVGKEGKAITPLRPSGTALIDGRRIDVVTEGDFIETGKVVVVHSVVPGRIVVGLKPKG